MKIMATALLTLIVVSTAAAQKPTDEYLDGLGLARIKTYSSHRVSSGNRFRPRICGGRSGHWPSKVSGNRTCK